MLFSPTGTDAVENSSAVSGLRPRLTGTANGAQAEGVQSPGEQPLQKAVAGRAAVVRVDDGQLICRRPVQVKIIEI